MYAMNAQIPHEDSMKIHFSAPSFRVAFAVIAALGCLIPVSASAERLTQTVRPEHYTLRLTPDLKAATFTGIETIDVNLAEPANRITLNAVELDLKSVTVTAGGKEQQATVTLDKEKELATFAFADKLPAGKAKLAIAYSGILNNELRGFYLSKTAKQIGRAHV